MKEVPLLLVVVRLALPLLYLLRLLVFFFLHSNLVIPNTLNSFLKIIDFLILDGVVAVLLVELLDQLAQLELLPLDEDVVTFQVFVLLLGED